MSLDDGPTVVAMLGYLAALDGLCDKLNHRVRSLVQRAEEAKVRWRRARMELAHVEARTANAESQAITAKENLREQVNHHSQLLRGVFLVELAKRKDHHPTNGEPPILEGRPVYCLASP